MNTNDERLTQLLHERADRHATHPVQLREVTRRARVIRRRRRTAAAAAVAAVVAAIAVPAALVFGGEPDASPPPTHQGSPSGTPAPTPSGSPTGTVGALAKLPSGPAPSVYTLGDRVHFDGGGVARLSTLFQRYAQVVGYHGGWLAFNEAEMKLVQTDGQGQVVATHDTSEQPFAISQDGTQVAWFWVDQADRSGHITLGIPSGMSDSEQRQAIDPGVRVWLLAVNQNKVYYVKSDGKDGNAVWTTDFVHPPQRVPGVATQTYDPVDQLVILAQSNGDGSRLYDVAHKRTLHNFGADWQPRSFSPDGKLILGQALDSDGNYGDYSLRETGSGRVRAEFGLTTLGIQPYQPVWQNDGTILVDASDRNQEAILRLKPDGKIERVTDPVAQTAAGYGIGLP